MNHKIFTVQEYEILFLFAWGSIDIWLVNLGLEGNIFTFTAANGSTSIIRTGKEMLMIVDVSPFVTKPKTTQKPKKLKLYQWSQLIFIINIRDPPPPSK